MLIFAIQLYLAKALPCLTAISVPVVLLACFTGANIQTFGETSAILVEMWLNFNII
jgi:hypothetical protein